MAEVVENPLPKARMRTEVHKHPLYYSVRNHIIDFLVTRSKTFVQEMRGRFDSKAVPIVRPGLVGPELTAETKVLRLGPMQSQAVAS
jgi:nitrate/nitrite transport system ATP-binding protein